jgi:hypothetical protein
MLRTVFGAMLLAHGLIHLAWFAPKQPDEAFPFKWHSLLFPYVKDETMKRIVAPMIIVQAAVLVVAALGVWGVPGLAALWVPLAVFGSVVSTIVMTLLWHPWFITGPLVNALIVTFALLGIVK